MTDRDLQAKLAAQTAILERVEASVNEMKDHIVGTEGLLIRVDRLEGGAKVKGKSIWLVVSAIVSGVVAWIVSRL